MSMIYPNFRRSVGFLCYYFALFFGRRKLSDLSDVYAEANRLQSKINLEVDI